MSESTIRIMCPNLVCRRVLAVPETARGRVIRCRGCGSTVKVPQKAPAPTQQPASDQAGSEGGAGESHAA